MTGASVPPRPQCREGFTIAILCALPREFDAVEASLDETYDHFGRIYGKLPGDGNAYTTGRIGTHNVVLCCMLGIGKRNASTAASSLQASYTGVRLALLVGVCGGVPFLNGRDWRDWEASEIILGDMVISNTIVEFDSGRQYPDGFRQRRDVRDTLGPNREIRGILANLKTTKIREEFHEQVSQYLSNIQGGDPKWKHPGIEHDVLYEATYQHKHRDLSRAGECVCLSWKSSGDPVCEEALKADCSAVGCQTLGVKRKPCTTAFGPSVHIGRIASGDTMMKSGEHRDRIARDHRVIAFEMEGAGALINLPCIIIKGVCHYGDSHKNERWQSYAAVTAAAGAKAFLSYCLTAGREGPKDNGHEVNMRCLRDLRLADPSTEKRRIEQTKGGLINESFSWALDSSEFREWSCNDNTQLMWIKGDAGKGKTMLMIGIVKELTKRFSDSSMSSGILAYFFCQGSDARLNSATAILRGLIYLLASQRPSLIAIIRKNYDHQGQKLFEGSSAFYGLFEIFHALLSDLRSIPVYLVVDALDECESSQEELLDLIRATTSPQFPLVKWIVSSRNTTSIELALGLADHSTNLSLELNDVHITQAVETYIDHNISALNILRRKTELQTAVRDLVRQKSGGTFLWVALMFDELRKAQLEREVFKILERPPRGLIPLYGQMLQRIQQLQDDYPQLCILLISICALAYRPLKLYEMRMLAGLEDEISEVEDIKRIVYMCSSFLTVRDQSIQFVHESAKDYVHTNALSAVFPEGRDPVHLSIFSRSLDALSRALQQGSCGPCPSTNAPMLVPYLLGSVDYSFVFWIDHLKALDDHIPPLDEKRFFEFLNEFFLPWLEYLVHLNSLSHGIMSIMWLLDKFKVNPTSDPRLVKFRNDAQRFVLRYRNIMEPEPLKSMELLLSSAQ